MIAILFIIGGILLLLFILGFPLMVIQGRSMYPTLKSSELTLVRKVWHPFEKPVLDSIYMYHVNDTRVIKRLTHIMTDIDGEVYCYFEGDNPPESYDSRNYGFINWRAVEKKYLTTIISEKGA